MHALKSSATKLAIIAFVLGFSSMSLAELQARIISADLGTTQILQAMDMQDAIVAVDVTSARQPGLQALPNIGYHRQLSPEGMLSIKADALVGSSHMGPDVTLDVLEKTGVQIVRQETPLTINRLVHNIRALSNTFHQTSAGEKLVRVIEQKQHQLEQSQLKHKTAIFLLDMGGHGGASGSIAGAGTSGEAFIKMLGLENLADFPAYREASRESLIALDPDVIILGGRNGSDSKNPVQSQVVSLTRAAQQNSITSIDASALVAGLSVAAIDEAIRVKTELNNN